MSADPVTPDTPSPLNPSRGYWYFTDETYCPLCGRSYKHRERKFTARPKTLDERHVIHEVYDYCDEIAI